MQRAKRKSYIFSFFILLGVEIGIAVSFKSGFVRGYLGDFLVVVLIYSALMMCSRLSVKQGLWISLLIAFSVECLQLIDLTQFFDSRNQPLAKLLLGNHFSGVDLLMYVMGTLLAYAAERYKTEPA